MRVRTRRQSQFGVVLAIVALGYVLSAYALDHHALRGDEGVSVRLYSQSFHVILERIRLSSPNPPLYGFMLHVWMRLAGISELAVRWPSVLAAVVTISLTYRLGRLWLGRRAGVLAALFAAINPFLVWYAQDARVYALLIALVLAAIWQTWEAALRRRFAYWLAAGGLWWLALFAHYFAIFPLACTGLALLVAPRTRMRWRAAVITALATGLAYLPLALYVAPLLLRHTKQWIQPVGIGEAVWRILTTFSVGQQPDSAIILKMFGGVALAILLCAGSLAALRRNLNSAPWLLALALGPVVMAWLISLYRPIFTEQYLISSVPGALMMAAAGALALKGALPRGVWWSVTFAASLALAAFVSLPHYYFDPAYAKSPDWRAVAAYLQTTARPEEVVVLNLPDPAFYYYYRGPMPAVDSPPASLDVVGLPAVETQLQTLRDHYQHIRFFFSPSPLYDLEGFVGQWLETCCEKTADTFVYGFRVQTFDTPSGSLAARQPYPVEFEKGITLTGYRVLNPQLRAGEAIHLTLYWTARGKVAESYTVFVHVLAADGYNVAGADSPPRNSAYPTDQWQAGEDVIDPHLVPLPADMPPGDYRLDVGLYRLDTGQRLMGREASGVEGDHVLLPVILTVQNH